MFSVALSSIVSPENTKGVLFHEQENAESSDKQVASDGADMQTDDKTMPTRNLPENGTRINMHFGDTVIGSYDVLIELAE